MKKVREQFSDAVTKGVYHMDYKKYIEFKESCIPKVKNHPCYSKEAHSKFGRIHVPVAPKCNVQCNYCVRKYDCANENRPGVTTRVISPDEAMQTIEQAVKMEPRIRVLGIAGPGDPLANTATFETLVKTKEEFPYLTRCLSTNGLALPERIDELDRAGITTLTITINAVDPEIGKKIYSFVRYDNKTYRGREAFEILSKNQLAGLKEASKRGMVVKVNSVLIPGINDKHLVEVAKVVRELGAYTMNVMPLIPQGNFKDIPPPTAEEVNRIRDGCEAVINQFRNCIQCRADAIGVPGEEGCSANILEKIEIIKTD
ncbi:feMo cofactor biosynthesis protein NifB [archaeon BMS3Bbin15]|nr:feMo cofactor biosynthesis protein NifB [archaeon BMS3Bbin15]